LDGYHYYQPVKYAPFGHFVILIGQIIVMQCIINHYSINVLLNSQWKIPFRLLITRNTSRVNGFLYKNERKNASHNFSIQYRYKQRNLHLFFYFFTEIERRKNMLG